MRLHFYFFTYDNAKALVKALKRDNYTNWSWLTFGWLYLSARNYYFTMEIFRICH